MYVCGAYETTNAKGTRTMTTDKQITIFADDIFAGQGSVDDDSILCDAVLGGDQDTSDTVYQEILCALEDGDESVTVDGVEYTWEITCLEGEE